MFLKLFRFINKFKKNIKEQNEIQKDYGWSLKKWSKQFYSNLVQKIISKKCCWPILTMPFYTKNNSKKISQIFNLIIYSKNLMNQSSVKIHQIEPFKYQQISSIELKKHCKEITLNPNQSILVLSLFQGLQQFYQFKTGNYKFIGNFNNIDNNMWLYFYKQQQIYSSFNSRNKLKTWSVNCINKNKVLCILKFNKDMMVVLINQSEDFMIIGCSEGKLHLKRKEQIQWYTTQEITIGQSLNEIILNQQENKIIAQVNYMKIVIVEKKKIEDKQIWNPVQEITIYNSFSNIIFIRESIFAVKQMNDKRWMLFKQKKNCQFAYKRDIQIFGTNDDLQYILDKYHAVNLDQSNSFLNLEFSLEQPFLALKDNKKFQNQSYFTSKYGDQKIIGEYFLSRDYRSKKIWIGKQKQLFIEYKINRELPIQENETYKAIAFQIQSQILIVGLNNLIKVFKLEEQTFTQQQVIKNHSGDVCCLLFLQNDNSFISGSLDKSLIIWFWDKKGQIYKCKQILKSAVEQKYIIINKQENLLVSGGNNLISFWIYQNSQWLQKQSLNFNSNSIFGLNFNPSQQLIATYSQNHKIILIKNKKNKTENYWFVSLQINIYNFTPSICFIQDFIILFQTINQTSLGLIKINFHANEIEYQTKILINRVCDEQTTFLMQFNQSKKVVINQTGSFLNLILIIQENQVLHHQEISFKSKYISGFMSTDGEFLITLDQDSKIIQIRKYHSN